MKHVGVISRRAVPARGLDSGVQSTIETLILLIIGVYFRSWDNFVPVIQNLQKYFQKV